MSIKNQAKEEYRVFICEKNGELGIGCVKFRNLNQYVRYTLHYLKDDVKQLWKCKNKIDARKLRNSIIRTIERKNDRRKRFVKTEKYYRYRVPRKGYIFCSSHTLDYICNRRYARKVKVENISDDFQESKMFRKKHLLIKAILESR